MAIHMASSFEVTVAFGGHGMLAEKLEAAGIRTMTIQNFQRNIHPLKELRTLRELYTLLKTEKPDIVHLNSSKAGLTGSIVARICRVPHIIFTIHGWSFLEPRNIVWKTATWCGSYLTMLFVHKAIPISQYDIAHAHMPAVRHKYTEVIYNAVPTIPFLSQDEARVALVGDEAQRHENDLWLITTAELHPKKNLTTAIEAVIQHNKTHTQKIYYLIIGDGILRETLKKQIAAFASEQHIQLLGYMQEARMYLRAADIFLLPSKQEGLPYALLEAGQARLPTIASDVCGIPEVITNKENGMLINPHKSESIAVALKALTESPQIRQQYGEALAKTIQSNHAIEHMAEKTKKAYLPHLP